uniref:Uncharacterized protein n=1 Tax=Ascaris lumbricoides TaxID=6252 RepID=A0A0M3IT76_ASCLU
MSLSCNYGGRFVEQIASDKLKPHSFLSSKNIGLVSYLATIFGELNSTLIIECVSGRRRSKPWLTIAGMC